MAHQFLRYDVYDWNDMCKESRPDAAKDRNGQICHYAERLAEGDKVKNLTTLIFLILLIMYAKF